MHRLTLSLIMVVLIAIVGLGWGLDQLFDKYSHSDNGMDGLSAYRLLGGNIAKTLDDFEHSDKLMQQWQTHSDITLSLSKLDAFPLPPELATRFLGGEPLTLASAGDISLHFYMPLKQRVFSMTLDDTETSNVQSNLSLLFTLVFYSGILSLVLLWLYPLIRRLLILSATAKAFGEGNLSQRVKKGSVSYISDIEYEFNNMAQRIQTLVSDNKLLGNAVSHDLRTPLARLRFGIDALSEENDPATRKKYEDHISDDIEKMESLVEILLSYARLDQAMIEIKKCPIDLTELLTESTHTAGTVKKITLNMPPQACTVLGDTRYFSILINNLLQNAISYSQQHIHITLKPHNEMCELIFEDDGPGIALKQREQVLKPFIRGDHPHENKGYGMGLAIVVRIVEWHGGSIQISDSKIVGGACIQIEVPCLTNNIAR